MKKSVNCFRLFAIILIVLLQTNCAPLALTGSTENLSFLGGFIAASSISPGIIDVPRDENGQPIIPENKSYIRIKLQDDPAPPPV